MTRAVIVALLVLLCCASANAVSSKGCIQRSPERSRIAIREFRRVHPCPATGLAHGACPGWQIDHIRELCCGGADSPFNMRWLTVEQHRERHAGGIKCDLR